MPDILPVRNVLVSVYEKEGLGDLVPGLLDANPKVMFYSTGGTYRIISGILDDKASDHLLTVEDYTGVPEMEGGLVKTLVPHVHAGLLGENNNPKHQDYMKTLSLRFVHAETGEPIDISKVGEGDYIPVKAVMAKHPVVSMDLVVVNLYDFETAISKPDTTPEKARGHIDIGGPTMVRAAAKNFMNTTVVIDPNDYERLLDEIKEVGGITFETRFDLAKKVFATTAGYDAAISKHLETLTAGDFRKMYKFEGGR
ncbi:MAG: hypothetical protein KAT77_03565 [Nanoarchaeota archaeon]|nr:hypothetical protein [Nanoarchaeota archaeon]